jgi:hypothetical protein
MRRQKFAPGGEPEPNARFTQLFERDAELVNKVVAALRGAGFCVARGGRGAAPDQLSGDVAPHARFLK